jgi:hypothetical protein
MTSILLALETSRGTIHVDAGSIVAVTEPMKKGQHPPSRGVLLTGSHRVYVLDTEDNLKKIFGVGHGMTATCKPEKPKARRKVKTIKGTVIAQKALTTGPADYGERPEE